MKTSRYARQSFLGSESDAVIADATVGVVGLGGGGSHIVQQLAHLGFQNYALYDGDVVEDSNLNRLIGATTADAAAETAKLHLAKMMIYGLQPEAVVKGFSGRWQERPESLRECDIVFGCVDGYQERHELEVACRRYLMHYIDIGMDVHGDKSPVIGGQIILSSPGYPCMRCIGFLTNEKLVKEAERYGTAGARPQVVWPNGVLASTAVGLAVNLVTSWTKRVPGYAYFVYDGNESTVKESPMLRNFKAAPCPHFRDNEVGDPVVIEL
jgi:hypothetical protein